MIFLSKSEKETQKLAGNLALKAIRVAGPVVITLEGELGAGKTTFVKGFAKALGIMSKIKSPTFTLMKKYIISSSRKFEILSSKSETNSKFLVHLDCYRVRDHKDLATLDLKLLFQSPENIVLVEWPERVSKILPKNIIRVHIDHIDKNKRKISLYNYSNF